MRFIIAVSILQEAVVTRTAVEVIEPAIAARKVCDFAFLFPQSEVVILTFAKSACLGISR